jgi:hypothetical protein
MKPLKLFLFLCFIAALSTAQSIPAIKAKALDDSEIVLPHPGSQQLLILVVGFSQKSGKACEVWSKKISADYRADPRIAYFSLPVLESAPSLIRPMIVYGIRKGIPAEERRHIVPIYSNESDWKKVVRFSAPDYAYLIVAGPDGKSLWQAHGAYSDAIYSELKKNIANLVDNSSNLPARK